MPGPVSFIDSAAAEIPSPPDLARDGVTFLPGSWFQRDFPYGWDMLVENLIGAWMGPGWVMLVENLLGTWVEYAGGGPARYLDEVWVDYTGGKPDRYLVRGLGGIGW